VLFYLKLMNLNVWEDLIASPVFVALTKSDQRFFLWKMTATNPMKAISLEFVLSDASSPEI